MNEKDQNLNAGEPHLDGEGDYTPPPESKGELKNVSEGVNVEAADELPEPGLDAGPDTAKVKYVGEDFEVGGGEEIDETNVEMPEDGVEYLTPTPPGDDYDGEKSPMDEIAEGTDGKIADQEAPSLEGAVAEPDHKDIPVSEGEGVVTKSKDLRDETPTEKVAPVTIDLNEEKFVEKHELTQSKKPGFDPNEKQDARYNDNKQEGGIARNRTTGNQFNAAGKPEGIQMRPGTSAPPDYSEMYEITGFTVSFEKVKGQGNVNVEIRDHFTDMETAQASVNGEKYLMPLPQVGFKIVEIVSGAPVISYQDRVLYENINGQWRRK